LNRLSGLANSWAGSFGFSYDALSRRTQMTRSNGVATNYSYDNLSRLLSVLHQLSGSTIDGAVYTVDAAGNRTSKVDQLAAVTTDLPGSTSRRPGSPVMYGYDAIYQLLSATQGGNTTESYSYDPVGNRLSSLGVSPYTYNPSNEMVSTPTAMYVYDNNGNMTSKADSTGTTNYTWDYENRLTQVTLPGSGGSVTFKYDPFGRRIEKVSSSAISIFAYDGDNLIEEVNATGTVVARYLEGQNIDEPLAMSRSGATSYYEADGLGSVTSLTSGAGAVAQTYTFDSFGKQTGSSGSLTNPFQYTARESDPETGLYYYRARYYDPDPGRFLSEDPDGYADGLNVYAYLRNSPLIWVDPMGLAHCTYSITGQILDCTPDDPRHAPVNIHVSSGNNGGGTKCKNNPTCTHIENRGPIPQGLWQWNNNGWSGKPNGRVLVPLPGTDTTGRDATLFRTHSCKNPFGPAVTSPFCSEGCITGRPDDMKKLNHLIEFEPGSILKVVD
jgi:RHS repeat-associated protein